MVKFVRILAINNVIILIICWSAYLLATLNSLKSFSAILIPVNAGLELLLV